MKHYIIQFINIIIFLLSIYALYFVIKIIMFYFSDKKKNILKQGQNENEKLKIVDKNKIYTKNDDDFLSRDEKKEKAQEIEDDIVDVTKVVKDDKGRLIVVNKKVEQEIGEEKPKIVGLANPKGFWTKFIMSQKMGYIMARMGMEEQKGDGFWVNFIKARANSQGKDQSRGR